jgi:hypothetical protein
MKKCLAMGMLIFCIICGSAAHAADSECDCNCKKGGMGLKIGKFVVGFGVKKFNSATECDNNIGIGIGIGNSQTQMRMGFGYDTGVIGMGIAFKGEFETISMGLGLGYDYGDCRMVWPIEE